MRSFSAQSLRRQLFIAIVLLLALVLAALWPSIAAFRYRSDELGIQARSIALTTAAYVDRDLAALDEMASGLRMNTVVRTLDPAQVKDLFKRVLLGRPFVQGIMLVASDGRVLSRSDRLADPPVVHEWADDVLSKGTRVVSDVQTGSAGRDRYVTIGYPVSDDAGQTVAALGFSIGLSSLRDAFASAPLPSGSRVDISDSERRLLVATADESLIGGVLPDTPSPTGEVQPIAQRTDSDGVERVYGRAVIPEGPWLVNVGIPTSVARDRTMSTWWRGLAILTAGLAGWLIAAVVLSRRFTRSVSHLDAAAKRIASGDFSAIHHQPMATREFQELQDAFDRMLERFNQTREAIDAQMAEERRIRQELQSLQRQVIRQERLAAVGQLVSGVAHEINNPLQAILGFAELLQMQPDVPDSVKADLFLIQKESTRACGIIRNLALFARQQPGEAAPVQLSDVISSVVELRQRRLETEHIELRIEDHSELPVLAVLTELQQVLLNFVVNAEQAIIMSGRRPGCITIRSRDEGQRVILEVEDTGPGIPAENEAKLFQPFFTTKPVGQGTGLGLSVSYGIIDSLGGRIGYRNARAGGAIFYFELPTASAELA